MRGRSRKRRTLARVLRPLLLGLLASGFLLAVALIILVRRLPPVEGLRTGRLETTRVMEARVEEARRRGHKLRPRQIWVPLEQVDPLLIQAVLLGEDAGFFGHAGIDWHEVKDSLEVDLRRGRFARGASTISMQLARNLFLGTDKTILRKAEEVLLTFELERKLDKKRILTIYLNVAEWGPGIFGVEAAARAHFGTSALELGAAKAAILSAMLPSPHRSRIAEPSAAFVRRAYQRLDLLEKTRRIETREWSDAERELARILGPRSTER